MITSVQCRMGRAALGWSVRDLAEAAEVGTATVHRFELERTIPEVATVEALRQALEGGGVRFARNGCVCAPHGAEADSASRG